MSPVTTRFAALEDIRIRAGDGRTVQAYAAVFNSPAEIHDQDGDYDEQIDPHAFDRAIKARRGRIFSVYNHGRTLHGTPSDLGSVPIGTPTVIRPDAKGLFTETVYNQGAYADQILSAIRSGSLSGMSFTGGMTRSTPQLPPGARHRARPDGTLPLVTRDEIDLIEFGPTPMPAYKDAAVVGVRSEVGADAYRATRWTPAERGELLLGLGVSTPALERVRRRREAALWAGAGAPPVRPEFSWADRNGLCPCCRSAVPVVGSTLCGECFAADMAAVAGTAEIDELLWWR